MTVAELEDWRDRFLLAVENSLRSRSRDEGAMQQEQIMRLERNAGQLVLDVDILKEGMEGHPFGPKTSDD